MSDEAATREQLFDELNKLRDRVAELEADRTKAWETDEALRESEERLKLALAGADEGLWDWSIPTEEVYFTPDFVERLGYEPDEIESSVGGWKGITHPDDLSSIRNDLIDLMKGRVQKYENEHRMRAKNGEWRWFLDRGKVVESDENGRAVRILGTYVDITNRKNAEEALRELQAESVRAAHLASVGELAAGVAHEINNPINSVINLAQILINECGSKTLEYDIAGRIIREGERIANIVTSLLSFASQRSDEKVPFHLHHVMSETLALTKTQVRKSGIALRVSTPENLPIIRGNPQRIQQVFLNIVNNARQALNEKYEGAHENKILDISSDVVTANGISYVRTTFYDTGTGIARDIKDKVLDPFFSTKPAGKGTGLGLSVSHGIVSDHRGRISVESKEGEYTKVVIELPAQVNNEKENLGR